MYFTSHDIAVIERALLFAIRHEQHKLRISELEEVLLKLRENTWMFVTNEESAQPEPLEQLRYEYDDAIEWT